MLARRFGYVRGSLNEARGERNAEEKQTQIVSMQTEQDNNTPTKTSSMTKAVLTLRVAGQWESFHFSDEDQEAETPPKYLPNYDLSEEKFKALRGKIDDGDNEIMAHYFTKLMNSGKHLRKIPRDVEAKDDLTMFKELLG